MPPPGTVLARGTPLTDAVRSTGEATRLLLVRFDRALLEALIAREPPPDAEPADASAPSDPFADVETALVWLLIEDGRRDIMIGDPAARIVRARAREIAGARGVTLVYPSGDEEDSRARRGRPARGAYRAGASRLGTLRGLARPGARGAGGTARRDGLDAWEGDWTRLAIASPSETPSSGGATPELPVESERITTDSLDEALQAGLGWLSDATGGDDGYRYGGEAGSSTEALVWVGPLDSVDAYASVMRFLEGVPGVGTVYPKEADERGTAFTVVPRGALPAIASSAESLSWLRRTSPPVPSPDGGRCRAGGDGTRRVCRKGRWRREPARIRGSWRTVLRTACRAIGNGDGSSGGRFAVDVARRRPRGRALFPAPRIRARSGGVPPARAERRARLRVPALSRPPCTRN